MGCVFPVFLCLPTHTPGGELMEACVDCSSSPFVLFFVPGGFVYKRASLYLEEYALGDRQANK